MLSLYQFVFLFVSVCFMYCVCAFARPWSFFLGVRPSVPLFRPSVFAHDAELIDLSKALS